MTTVHIGWRSCCAVVALVLVACGSAAPPAGRPGAASQAASVGPAGSSPGSSSLASAVAKPGAAVNGSQVPEAISGSAGSTAASTPPASSLNPLSQSKLRFAIPVSSGLQVLPQLAQEAGYFKDQGLDVTITQIPGSQEVIAALHSGDLDMANSDSPSVIQAHLSAIPTEILAVPVTKPIFDFMVPAGITKPQDLAGKAVAVTKVCDSTCFQVTRAMQSWGLKPQQDVKLLPLQDYPGMFAGLRSNQVSGAPLAPPFNFQAQKIGFHSLADLSQLPIEYPTAVVQAIQPFTTAHPDTVAAFLRAYVKTIHRYKSDEAFTVNVYRKFLKSDDTQVIEGTWNYYQRLLHDDPTPTVEGAKFVLDSLAETGNQKAKAANPADFIEPRFMEQVKAGRASL